MKCTSFFLCTSPVLFLVINLYGAKITVWNNTFYPIQAQVNYSKNKTKDMDIPGASHKSWDNVWYNVNYVTINNKKLDLDHGIRKDFDVHWDGANVAKGIGISPEKYFISPDPSLRYDQATFLAAHNAHSAHPYGYLYAQQDKKIEDQLEYGARGLLLDTYSAKKSNLTKEALPVAAESLNNYEVMMWHGPVGRNLKKTFKDALEKIKTFLTNHPTEIVTIQLENYAPNDLIDAVIKRSNISSLVLKASDWNPVAKKGWPTLQWMIDNNKRLVIFNNKGKTKYCYDQWKHTIENQYGQLDVGKASVERAESMKITKPKYLYTLNFFGKVTSPVNYPDANSSKLRKLINNVFDKGLKGKLKGRYPNFIALDYISRGKDGDPIKLINEINHRSRMEKNGNAPIFKRHIQRIKKPPQKR